MAEYKDMIAPKELKTLEIDLEKNVLKLNGDNLERCSQLVIFITPMEVNVTVYSQASFYSQTSPRKFPRGKSYKEV